MRPARTAVGSALLLCVLSTACLRVEPETAVGDPEQAALELFRLAEADEWSEQQLQRWFAVGRDLRDRAELGDALERLSEVQDFRVVRVEPVELTGQMAVNLLAELGGDDVVAEYTVLLEWSEGRWVVRSFAGPAVDWPPAGRTTDGGLTTSAPPESPDR